MAAITTAFFIVTLTFSLVNSSSADKKLYQHMLFTYSGGTGPNKWGSLDPKFTMCANGKSQSPINIVKAKVVVDKKLKPLIREYNSVNVTLVNNKFNVAVVYPSNCGKLIVDDKKYSLKQMHWHSPSEHRIDGQQGGDWNSVGHAFTEKLRFAAELHLVHVADDGSVSVVGILFQLGRPDPVIEKIQNKLSELANEVRTNNEETPVTVGPFHPTEVRKNVHKYYKYVGSFTTPPCTENVTWVILAKVRSMSKEQVEALKAPLDTGCKNNNRPVQESHGRLVELYEEQPNHV
ncbi:alpha carbonic anhydrase 1, chloroplastic-like isoform X2 [Olea europaea var. sylvestris]|uniref:alpha carbonic anhydrase 1, chloroplastic-like isoform X2 n=1 Tax=Olea europaea var. sylvestris TaxID=158386 RepID=UPI000C1D2CA6|nr:alpha carbonic anhydrase 1, chloroplastic-like isoform X2 [Olea europaea var. sylvestris]